MIDKYKALPLRARRYSSDASYLRVAGGILQRDDDWEQMEPLVRLLEKIVAQHEIAEVAELYQLDAREVLAQLGMDVLPALEEA